MREDIQTTVFSIIAREADIDENGITPDSTLRDMKVHSLDAVQIVFAIEDHYRILIPDRDPGFDTKSVKGLMDAVEKLLAEKASNPSSISPAA
ncbi:MAG TPA: phosphopantetheine-binding protein [Rhodanobacteraceae bacterium]|nr:phosphopantetheine-binding protein [Rhodanobacteraceae bacterium]